MSGAFDVGAVALKTQQRALDTIANNIANVNTPTFKRSDLRFSEIMATQAEVSSRVEEIAQSENVPSGGVRMVPRDMIFIQGEMQATGNRLDLAINGRGFIELLGPSGQSLLWRGGALNINQDGLLSSADGMALRALITVPDDATDIQISAEGIVSALTANDEIIELGQISLVRVESESTVERLDSGLFRADIDARLTDSRPGEDGLGTLVQGSIEGSNVELSAEMVQLLIVQRAYAANAQIIQAADQISTIMNNLTR